MKPDTLNVRSINGPTTSPVIPPLLWAGEWRSATHGATLHDQYSKALSLILSAPVLVVDVETNGMEGSDCVVTGVGVCRDDKDLFWFRDLDSPAWLDVARHLEKCGIVGHNVRADIEWLNRIGCAVTEKQIYWDTYIASYAEDPGKDGHGLKHLCEFELDLAWPNHDDMTERIVGEKRNKKTGEVSPVYKKFNLEEIYAVYPEDVIDYNGMDILGTYRLMVKQQKNLQGQRRLYHDRYELPFSYVVSAMEKQGIRVDRGELDCLGKAKTFERDATLVTLRAMVNDAAFNPGSWQQVLKVLKTNGHDVKKTDEETIRPLANKDPFVKSLLYYRGVVKLVGTYIEPLLEHSNNTEQRVHTHFNQCVTATGRLSSSKPLNLQNQPPEVRPFFIPKEGHVFVCADYSQIDLRSLCHLCMEPVYVEAFNKGRHYKIHQAVADKFEVEYKLGKIISLALAYNGGVNRLIQEAAGWGIEIPFWKAKKLVDAFIRDLSVLTAWKEEQYRIVKENGYVTTILGRRISLPYPSKEEITAEPYKLQNWKNKVIAYQGQGGTGDIIKVGMLRLFNKGYVPVAQVHDEVLYEVPAEKAEEAKKVVQHELEAAVQLRVPLYVEVGTGRSWAEAKPK